MTGHEGIDKTCSGCQSLACPDVVYRYGFISRVSQSGEVEVECLRLRHVDDELHRGAGSRCVVSIATTVVSAEGTEGRVVVPLGEVVHQGTFGIESQSCSV